MNKELKQFCNEVCNEEARRQLEAELNFMSKEKIELPKGKDYLTLFAETHKTDEEIIQEQLEEKDKEIDRLNNIIDVLENELRSDLFMSKLLHNDYAKGRRDLAETILSKLKELKEGK